MSDTVDKIKERLNIVDVISPYVKLTRAGKYWKGLSPFNKEKTPSFFVSPDRGMYHCFSSGKGGDIFTFVEEMEGVDFKGALKILAEKAGVALVYESPAAGDEKNRIYSALFAARDLYVAMKKKEPAADAYLASRGLKNETVTEWGVGYAPDEWRALHDALVKQGFPENILEKAGLIKRRDESEGVRDEKDKSNTHPSNLTPQTSRYYDRFRGRIMFPIEDISGRVIGFSGRILKEDPNQPGAKYINSPETAVFDKSRALYGLKTAREGIRQLGAAFLVEGQLDLLMAHQAGYKNTVATSGTAFTKSHAELIKRYSQNLLIAYDGDRAGVAAAGRAATVALPLGLNVKIATFPPGKDPADLLRESPDVFKSAVKEAQHVVDFYLSYIKDAKYDPRTYRLEVSRTVLPYVAMVENRIDQAHFIKRVAEALSVPEDAVRAELKKVQSPESRVQNKTSDSELRTRNSELSAAGTAAEPFLSRTDTIERLVFGVMLVFSQDGNDTEANRAKVALKEAVGDARLTALMADDAGARAALFEADFFLTQHEDGARANALQEMYADFHRESLHEKYREALATLHAAEKVKDDAAAESAMQVLNRLAKTLK